MECTGNDTFLTVTGAFDKRRGGDNAQERTDLRRVVLIRDPNFCELLGLFGGDLVRSRKEWRCCEKNKL